MSKDCEVGTLDDILWTVDFYCLTGISPQESLLGVYNHVVLSYGLYSKYYTNCHDYAISKHLYFAYIDIITICCTV